MSHGGGAVTQAAPRAPQHGRVPARGIPPSALHKRLDRGWSVQRIVRQCCPACGPSGSNTARVKGVPLNPTSIEFCPLG
jgi:hypothetical protein